MSSSLELWYIITGLTGISCLFHFVYKFLRDNSSIKVNCWFCNVDFRVPYKKRNEWFCQLCQQFNGFKKDGDYIKTPAQLYDETLNKKFFSQNLGVQMSNKSNGLCKICNANQEMKVKQLAMYVPYRDENYDEEIEIFKRKLEDSYKLCDKCEYVVKNKLQVDSKSSHINNSAHDELMKDCKNPANRHRKTFYLLSVVAIAVLTLMLMTFMVYGLDLMDYSNFHIMLFKWLTNIHYYLKETTNFNVLDLLLVLLAAFFAQSVFQNAPIFISIISSLFTFMVADDLSWNLKIVVTSTMATYFTFKYLYAMTKHKKLKSEPKKTLYKKNIYEEVDHSSSFSENEETISLHSVPLCGKFSGMNLGKANSKKGRLIKNPSYLFTPKTFLVKPPKLKIDNSIYSRNDLSLMAPPSASFLRSSPTVSSGYESTTNSCHQLKLNNDVAADGVSEFDSISQIGFSRRSDPLSVAMVNNLSSTPNMVRLGQLERYEKSYGVSPIYNWSHSSSFNATPDLSNSTMSTVQVNAFVPIFQTVTCSIGCFILGFFFQSVFKQIFS